MIVLNKKRLVIAFISIISIILLSLFIIFPIGLKVYTAYPNFTVIKEVVYSHGNISLDLIEKMKEIEDVPRKQIVFEDKTVFPMPDGAVKIGVRHHEYEDVLIVQDQFLITEEALEKYERLLIEMGFENDRMSEYVTSGKENILYCFHSKRIGKGYIQFTVVNYKLNGVEQKFSIQAINDK